MTKLFVRPTHVSYVKAESFEVRLKRETSVRKYVGVYKQSAGCDLATLVPSFEADNMTCDVITRYSR